jgi:hypothetical protein
MMLPAPWASDGPYSESGLSRARERLRLFIATHCGLVNHAAACSCSRRITPAIAHGRVDPKHLLFADVPREDVAISTREVETLYVTSLTSSGTIRATRCRMDLSRVSVVSSTPADSEF